MSIIYTLPAVTSLLSFTFARDKEAERYIVRILRSLYQSKIFVTRTFSLRAKMDKIARNNSETAVD